MTNISSNEEPDSSFIILRPAGNDTALVSGIVKDPVKRKAIADVIQREFPNVEQVGFINPDKKNAELLMTGGEFCGNATRSAVYHILSMNPGKIKIKASGVKKKLLAGITEDGDCFSQMPVYSDPSYVKADPKNKGNYLVELEGITHYVDFNVSKIKTLAIDEIKERARAQMFELGINSYPACGIIYAEALDDGWIIHPVVYVRDANTLYYETACGSGTTAFGLVHALKKGGSVKDISVMQPSGLSIKVSVEFNGSSFGYVQIQSPIKRLGEGVLKAENNSKQNSLANLSTRNISIHNMKVWA